MYLGINMSLTRKTNFAGICSYKQIELVINICNSAGAPSKTGTNHSSGAHNLFTPIFYLGSLVFIVEFCTTFFYPFSFDHCIVCPLNYSFLLLLCIFKLFFMHICLLNLHIFLYTHLSAESAHFYLYTFVG